MKHAELAFKHTQKDSKKYTSLIQYRETREGQIKMDLWRSRGAAGDTRLWPVVIYDSVCVSLFNCVSFLLQRSPLHIWCVPNLLAKSYRIGTRGLILRISISKVYILRSDFYKKVCFECAETTHMNNHLSLCKQKLFHTTHCVSCTVICNTFVR